MLTVIFLPCVYIVIILVILGLGLMGLPTNFEVDIEYLNGILTASSILFGFWAVILGRSPGDIKEKYLYKYGISKIFFFNIAFLAISVIAVFFSATNKLSSVIALFLVTLSYFSNLFFLVLHLYYYFKHLTE